MKKYKDIDTYISDFPEHRQKILNKIRETIKKAAPEALESISYGMPTFKLKGKNLVHFAAFKNHYSLFPTPSPITKFDKDLKNYRSSKGTVQFQNDQNIPYELISKITKFRVEEMS